MRIEPLEISPQALDEMLRSEEPFHLVDVRAGWEHELVALPDNLLIPLHTLGARAHELDRGKKIVVYCHHGCARTWRPSRCARPGSKLSPWPAESTAGRRRSTPR